MQPNDTARSLLRKLPGVDHVLACLKTDPAFEGVPQTVKTASVRAVIDRLRQDLLAGSPLSADDLTDETIVRLAARHAQGLMTPNLRPMVNATGIVVHTNLGRSLLATEACANVQAIVAAYSNLEFDLAAGRRGSRYAAVEDLLCELSGAEAAMVVNNNAAAVLLCLETLARGRKVIVSRGELVEIGGSFRIPDIMAKSGCRLVEVGTTNRTHRHDYAAAVDEAVGLLLKVHTSNYSVVGFTAAVSLAELVALGAEHGLPVMEDLGSGTFIDFSAYGLDKEPTVQESVRAGADVVTFSGDKLLGGPQAGIIVGRSNHLESIRRNPLTRALRIDKMTLAALESTLRLYRDERQAVAAIPTLRMLFRPPEAIAAAASELSSQLSAIGDPRLRVHMDDTVSRAGGGALPALALPSKCLRVRVQGLSPNALEARMRRQPVPVIGRIEDDAWVLDLRTVQADDLTTITRAFKAILKGPES